MRKVIALAILLLSFLGPVQRLDVARLEPVETVAIAAQEGKVILKTDTESIGTGSSVQEALQNLKNSTPNVIYLDTAQCLLVKAGAEKYVPELRDAFKASVSVGVYCGGDVAEEARYQQTHGKMTKLSDWKHVE